MAIVVDRREQWKFLKLFERITHLFAPRMARTNHIVEVTTYTIPVMLCSHAQSNVGM